jgi:RNA polymerase sigma-54 factor
MNENPALETGKEEEDYEKDEFENEDYDDYDDAESRIEAEDINIDEYLSNDETPDYKTQTSNYSDDDDDANTICCSSKFHQDLINQLNFILNDEEREIVNSRWQY